MRKETVERGNIETAKRMLQDGELSVEKIALYANLSIEKVKEIASQKIA